MADEETIKQAITQVVVEAAKATIMRANRESRDRLWVMVTRM